MNEQQNTDDIQRELLRVIEELGGLANASTILDVPAATLTEYINGQLSTIVPRVWGKLKKYLFVDKIALYANLAASIRESRNIRLDDKRIAENPFAFLECIAQPYSYNDTYPEEFKEAVTQCRDDKNASKFYLHRKMIEFAQIYNAFRPSRVDSYHPYYGTVGKMDAIYNTLFRYLDIPSDIRFSKWPEPWHSAYITPKKLEHDEIDWEELVSEIESVQHSLENAIGLTGFDMFLQFGSQLPWLVLHYVKAHIRSLDSSITDDEIEFDTGDRQTLIIRGERVRVEERYQLSDFIRERRKT